MLEGSVAFLFAFLVGSLAEYVTHRLMHRGVVLQHWHAGHHKEGWGQGVLGEFLSYAAGPLLLGWAGFLYSLPAGIGWAAGGVVYAALAAYAHQLQHERPELVFWMPRPVHHLHHKHHMWHNNFGILTDLWDRVLGTYKVVEWQPDRRPRDYPWRTYLQIKWY
jgi:sterol desaturase/sphingolipid hydroxylase (fatty acid hydroxylase superfamily)